MPPFECSKSFDYLNSNKVYFIGDFNIPEYIKLSIDNNINSTTRTLALLVFLSFFDLAQLNNINNCNNRFLDLVIKNRSSKVSKADDIEDAYHPALSLCFLSHSIQVSAQTNKVQIYNFRKANYALLYEMILNCDLTFLKNFDNVNTTCIQFYDTFRDILDICVPKYTPRNASNKYP